MARTATQAKTEEVPSIHSLGIAQKQAFMREVWGRRSRFQSEFGADGATVDCVEFAELFQKQVVRLLSKNGIHTNVAGLTTLHEVLSDEMKAYGFDDGVNKVSTLLYDADEDYYKVY